MQELGDIDRAINFCKEHDDTDLWEDLIKYSLKKPGMIYNLTHLKITSSTMGIV